MDDLTSYFQKPNNWFATKHRYVGQGEAEFLDPRGSVFGKTVIVVKETGDCEVKLRVESCSADEVSNDLVDLLDGPPCLGLGLPIWSGSMSNTCTKLTVKTKNGTFNVDEDIRYSRSLQDEITFNVSLCYFNGDSDKDAKYWVLPLVNFLSAFRDGNRVFDEHPLRIRRIPKFPDTLSQNLATVANAHELNARRNMIIFEYDGKPAFIEPLSDYEKRAEKLRKGNARSLVTAVMVGEINGESLEIDSLEKSFPFQFLDLLSLATGTKVVAPWIEFRDEQGQLVRRLHYLSRHTHFETGYKVIDEIRDQGTGQLLTQAQYSKYYDDKTLHVLTEIAALSSGNNLTIDDRFAYLIRALDTLCYEGGFYETHQPKKILNPQNMKSVDQIKDCASKEILRIEAQIEDKESKEAQVLRRIADKIKKLDEPIRIGFWQALLRLLEKFEIKDAKVLEKHLPKKLAWTKLVTERRGMVIHRSYFRREETPKKDHQLEQYKFTSHLHDVLIRILLKMWNYDGTYQSTSSKWVESKSLDWVTEDTPPSELGY